MEIISLFSVTRTIVRGNLQIGTSSHHGSFQKLARGNWFPVYGFRKPFRQGRFPLTCVRKMRGFALEKLRPCLLVSLNKWWGSFEERKKSNSALHACIYRKYTSMRNYFSFFVCVYFFVHLLHGLPSVFCC